MFCFLLYGNTLSHDYALDDTIVITKNDFTKQGIQGIPEILSHDSFTGFFGEEKNLVTGGRYRPLSQIMFAIEYELFGLNPFIGHLVNILLYGLLGIFLFQLFLDIGINVFPRKETGFLMAMLATLLFLAHPIHTEVVANIKGRDEILALTLGTGSLLLVLKSLKSQRFLIALLSALVFFLALLSKENAATFIMLTPLTIFLFYSQQARKITVYSLPLLLSMVVYLFIRGYILEDQTVISTELMNNPFTEARPDEKTGTILFTLGYYLKLLVFPHPLTYDYYPYHIELTTWKSAIPVIVFFIYLVLVILLFLTFKKKNVLAYALLWFFIPLVPVSNIFFPVGVFMGERFLFFSSVGFCLVIAFLFSGYLYEKWDKPWLMVVFTVVILVAYSYKTIDRNMAWKDDYTLFTTDVRTSANSAKANTTAGGIMYEKAVKMDKPVEKNKLLQQAKSYLEKAITIYPAYTDARLLLGNVNWELYQNFDSVWPHYSVILKKTPQHVETLNNIQAIVSHMKQPRKKTDVLRLLHCYRPSDYEVNYLLGTNYGKGLQMLDSAKYFLKRAAEIKPTVEALKDLGVAYGMSGEPEMAISWFEKALAKDTTDRQLYINLGVSHQKIGNLKQARDYFSKAQKMEP